MVTLGLLLFLISFLIIIFNYSNSIKLLISLELLLLGLSFLFLHLSFIFDDFSYFLFFLFLLLLSAIETSIGLTFLLLNS